MSKLDELIAWEANLVKPEESIGDWVDGSAACTTTVGHVRAALTEIKQLRADVERLRMVLKAAGKAYNESAAVKDNAFLRSHINELLPALMRAKGLLEKHDETVAAAALTDALRKWPRDAVDEARRTMEEPKP